MKVYQVNYDNGWDYSDHDNWVSNVVYTTKEDALQELIKEGYKRTPKIKTVINWGDGNPREVEIEIHEEANPGKYSPTGFAFIAELELIEEVKKLRK